MRDGFGAGPTMEISIDSPMKPRYWHYWIGLLLCLALFPVLRSQHLPLKFDWITLGIAFWFLLAAQSIFVAVLLSLIGLPREQVVGPFLTRCRRNRLRIIVLFFFFAILGWLTTWPRALVVGVDAVALLELVNRQKSRELRHAAASAVAPAVYLFFGFLMVLAYNCAVVSMRFNFATDPALAAIDRWLLSGHSVSEFAHWSLQIFSISFFKVLEFIYFGMFPQIGAALVLVALCDGRARAWQFVGTILVSYYLALALFYIWPSQGPYYLCPAHFSRFPDSLQVYNLQKTLIRDALALWRHDPISRISTDYFIALPCMHIAQPMVVIWFLRRWRRIALALAIYDALLIAAVLMLEQHYVIDIIAGFLVAGLAIAINGGLFSSKSIEPATTRSGVTA
ncbi:MAG TPA: phosphatase PAP2 family protein [Candidatus Sulfotelmatobacter sp.]